MSSICEIQSNQLCRECQDKPILRGESLCEDCWSADYDREDDEGSTTNESYDDYMNELIECSKCEEQVKRKDLAWTESGAAYTDVCEKCVEKEECHRKYDGEDEYDEDMCDKCSKGLKMPNKYGSCECVCKCGELFWECRYKCDIINLYKSV
jgi:hypothetical protein